MQLVTKLAEYNCRLEKNEGLLGNEDENYCEKGESLMVKREVVVVVSSFKCLGINAL